jgi:hypothetical protein
LKEQQRHEFAGVCAKARTLILSVVKQNLFWGKRHRFAKEMLHPALRTQHGVADRCKLEVQANGTPLNSNHRSEDDAAERAGSMQTKVTHQDPRIQLSSPVSLLQCAAWGMNFWLENAVIRLKIPKERK